MVETAIDVATSDHSCYQGIIPSAQHTLQWERALSKFLGDLYRPVQDGDVDFESIKGHRALMTKPSLLGARDLDAALMRLASATAKHNFERSTLLARFPKMSANRVRNAWDSSRALLRSDLGQRLGLAAIAMDRDVIIPDGDLELRKIVALAREAEADGSALRVPTRGTSGAWSSKQFQVWMVLLDAWLRREEPLAIKELLSRSGTSTATVKSALDRLTTHGDLDRTTDRRATLAGFPRRSMDEIITLADALRGTNRLVDGSGRPPNADGLLRRLRTHAPASVALGGVHAARHYAPTFDLEGIPRIDLSIHGLDNLDWLTRVDPALRPARTSERSADLVVHWVLRPYSGADELSHKKSFASPAETLLDLYDLRLTEQAADFVNSLRQGHS